MNACRPFAHNPGVLPPPILGASFVADGIARAAVPGGTKVIVCEMRVFREAGMTPNGEGAGGRRSHADAEAISSSVGGAWRSRSRTQLYDADREVGVVDLDVVIATSGKDCAGWALRG